MYFHSLDFKVTLLRLFEIILKTFIEPEMASVSSEPSMFHYSWFGTGLGLGFG